MTGILAATATALLVAAAYLVFCYVSPFARCSRCGGLGRRTGRILRASRPCRRCRGRGRRIRVGRRLVNVALRRYAAYRAVRTEQRREVTS